MGRTSTYEAWNRALDGQLGLLLAEWREAGDTYETIAERLRIEHGISVTTSTVFRWLQRDLSGDAA